MEYGCKLTWTWLDGAGLCLPGAAPYTAETRALGGRVVTLSLTCSP